MLRPVPAGGIWDFLTGKSRKPAEPRVPDAFVPQPPEAAPAEPVVYADPAVESMCCALGVAASSRVAGMRVAETQLGLAGVALELVREGRDDREKSRVALGALDHLQAQGVPGPWSFGQSLLEAAPQPHQKVPLAQLVLASTAAEPAGLAGLGLACARALDSTYNSREVSAIGQRTLTRLDSPAARLGLVLSRAVKQDHQRVPIHELFLAGSEQSSTTELAALGLQALDTLDRNYASAERAQAGRALLEHLASDPAVAPTVALALAVSDAAKHPYQRIDLQETFLRNLDQRSTSGHASVGLKAIQTLDPTYATAERAAAGRVLVDRLAVDPNMAPMLSLARDMADSVGHPYQRVPFYEQALAAPQAREPRELVDKGRAMLATLDPTYSTRERAAASRVLLERLKQHPETETLADLALMMQAQVSHDYQRVALADSVLQSISDGKSSELGVAESAMGTLDATYSAKDLSRVAMAVLERTSNADADLVLEAMRAVPHDYQRCAMAGVIFAHLLAPEPPPFSQLARGLIGSFDASYSAADAVAAGRVLARRYSDPRARTHLDAALCQPHAYQQAAALREAFEAIAGIDDDIAQIKNMANALTGQAPTSTVVEKKGAVLVGGVRLRVRREDVESTPG